VRLLIYSLPKQTTLCHYGFIMVYFVDWNF
jgi:hypothetical protein